MTPNEQKMWYEIAQAIEPYCINGGGFIYDNFEEPSVVGFEITTFANRLSIKALIPDVVTETFIFEIEDDIRLNQLQKQAEGKGYYDYKTLNWVDAPGTFEGIEDKPG